MSRLPFVELELTHALGPEPGRYLLDDGNVLTVAVRGAPVPPLRLRRGPRTRPAAESRPVPLAVVRHVLVAERCANAGAADRWLRDLERDPDAAEVRVATACVVLNRAIAAFRVALQNPYLVEVSRPDPRRVALGHGTPEQVDRGEAEALFELGDDRPRGGSSAADRAAPAEEAAAVLAGRASWSDAHELYLRALLDLGHGRPAAAFAGLRAALDLAGEPAPPAGVADAAEIARLCDGAGPVFARLRAQDLSVPAST